MHVTNSQCVSAAIVIQEATRMRRTVLPSTACPSPPCFSTLSHKRYNIRKTGFWAQNVFWFSVHIFSETLLILGSVKLRWFCDLLWAGRSGDRIPVEARFSAPVHKGPAAHPASYTIGASSFPGVKWPRRGVDHPPHLAPRLRKE